MLCYTQVKLVDEFYSKKNGLTSHCYRIVYRSMTKTFTQEEVNVMHQQVEQQAAARLHVTIR